MFTSISVKWIESTDYEENDILTLDIKYAQRLFLVFVLTNDERYCTENLIHFIHSTILLIEMQTTEE